MAENEYTKEFSSAGESEEQQLHQESTLPRTILVVDDESIVAEDLAERIRNLGFHVIGPALSFGHALELAQREQCTLAILDIDLGESSDGIELAKVLAQDFSTPSVFLTGCSDPGTFSRAKDIAPYNFLVKPAKEREIQVTLELTFRRIAAERELEARKEREKELIQYLGEAQREELVGRIAGGVAHHLNNGLQAIQGNLFLADRGVNGRNRIQLALKGCDRCAELARSLLGLVAPSTFSETSLAVDHLIRETADLASVSFGEAFLFKINAEEGLTVLGDRGQLRQVLLNLFLNAKEAMPDGGIIGVKARRTRDSEEKRLGDKIEVSVSDQGRGMSQQQAKEAFKPFFSATSTNKGFGLGLSASQAIMRRHGGSIELPLSEEKGTTVVLVFPSQQEYRERTAKSFPSGTLPRSAGPFL